MSVSTKLFINNSNNSNSNKNNSNNININQYENINNNEYNKISKKMIKSNIIIKSSNIAINSSNKKIYELLQLYNYNNNINKIIKLLSNENKKSINNLFKKNEILRIIKLLKVIKKLKNNKPQNKEFINKNQIDKIENLNEQNKLQIIKLLKKNKLYKKNITNRFTMLFSKENILDKLSKENKKLINKLLNIAKKVKENKIAELEKMNKLRGFNKNNNVNNIRQTLSNGNRVNIRKIIRMVDTVHKYFNSLDPSIVDIFKPVFDKLFIQNIKLKDIKSRKLFNGNYIFELNPEIYDSNINGNIKINSVKNLGKGSFSTVYTNISVIGNKNTQKLNSIILKIIDDKSKEKKEFKSLIFNICLLALLYFQNSNGIKYFCDLYEFGKVKEINNCFYAIMENGGFELQNIFYSRILKKENTLNSLNIVLYVIKECAKAIQVLHNINIIHCDIKLQNFLYLIKYSEYYIKIIDFGFCTKNGTVVKSIFGTPDYIPSDFYYSIQTGNKYIITIKNDIYSLGIMFIILLSNIFNKKYYVPIVNKDLFNNIINKKNLDNIDNIISKNIKTNIGYIIEDLKDIFQSKNDSNGKKKYFFERLNTILTKITYLEGNYDNLLRFIDDIDNLIELLKKINIII